MILNINFPDDLMVKSAIEFNRVPCVCSIQINGLFEIYFRDPLFSAKGYVSDFNNREVNRRFPVLGGSNLAQYCDAMISIRKIKENQYEIVDLIMFYHFGGWISIMEDGVFSKVMIQDYNGY